MAHDEMITRLRDQLEEVDRALTTSNRKEASVLEGLRARIVHQLDGLRNSRRPALQAA